MVIKKSLLSNKRSYVPETLGLPDNSPPCTAKSPALYCSSNGLDPLSDSPFLFLSLLVSIMCSGAAVTTIFALEMLFVGRTKGTFRPCFPGRLCIPRVVNGEYVRLNLSQDTNRGAMIMLVQRTTLTKINRQIATRCCALYLRRDRIR